jgi:hypothetical protein
MKTQSFKRFLARFLPGLVMGVLALLVVAPRAKANDWDDCNRRIANANYQLHEAVEDYGYASPQANYWRHELHEAYEELAELRRNGDWRENDRGGYYDNRYNRDRDGWYNQDRDEGGGYYRQRNRDEDDD